MSVSYFNVGACKCPPPECDKEDSCSQGGVSDANGWESGPGLTNKFTYDDSANCNDYGNSQRQHGICVYKLTLDVESEVTFHVWGNVEEQDSGYDRAIIRVDGATKAYINGEGNGYGCSMIDQDDSSTEVLAAGTYCLEFIADTLDGLYHTNMVHNFEVTVVENAP